MDKFADLSIVLSRFGRESFWVELRFTQPDERIVPSPERGPARLNFDALRAAAGNPEKYGRLLCDAIFYDDPTGQVKLLTYLNAALTLIQNDNLDLHISLYIDPGAAELHNLHWETLANPQDGSFLAWDQNVLFSRHLYARELGQMELRSKGDLTALVFVANPAELSRPGGYNLRTGADSQRSLPPVNVADEVRRAQTALSVQPDNVPSDQLSALLSAFSYIDTVRNAFTDNKISRDELSQIAQLGANATAGLNTQGGAQLQGLSGKLNEITGMLARGQMPEAKNRLGEFESALGTRPSGGNLPNLPNLPGGGQPGGGGVLPRP